jgi:hypothetical protein
LAVTDHSEWMGVVQGCTDASSPYYNHPDCVSVRASSNEPWPLTNMGKFYNALCASGDQFQAACAAEQRSVWMDEQQAAANAYQPCVFTSFIAHEWTNGGGHRNVIFGSGVVPSAPLDSQTYTDATSLWNALDSQCTAAAGCRVVTPAHNTNYSAGAQFALPASPSDVPQMQKYQPTVEIYQSKGASECYYPGEGASDPYCQFEYLLNVNPKGNPPESSPPQAFVRTALETGLSYALENSAGNPLQMGFIGATDDHNATPGHVQESAYEGHLGRGDDLASNRLKGDGGFGSGGLTVAWAEQNTRDSVFSAIQRRETYATSGPRIVLRFYQTTNPNPCTADFPQTIINQGGAVPMGGTFGPARLVSGAPHFAIAAWPDSEPQVVPTTIVNGVGSGDTTRVAKIEYVQVIKAHGSVDSTGKATITEDKLVDLPIDPNGGCIAWSDPNFKETEMAFYYVRVLQEPTWRWSHFDCEKDPTAAVCTRTSSTTTSFPFNRWEHERAWSSPIWYQP